MPERKTKDAKALGHCLPVLLFDPDFRYDCRMTAAEAESSRPRSREARTPAALSPRAASTVDRRSSYVSTGRSVLDLRIPQNSLTERA